MSAPTKEFYRLLMEGKIIHGGHPVLRWMAGNVVVDTDPAGNIKVTKAKSKEKIDGIVAAIMALDQADISLPLRLILLLTICLIRAILNLPHR